MKKEGDMTPGLVQFLRAVGLQRHYARFITMGVCCLAHLSVLTMEDYPLLGISTMEDRRRLFHLIQMAKTLDLEEDDDKDCNANGGTEDYTVTDSSNYDGYCDPHADAYVVEDGKDAAVSGLNVVRYSKPSCVCRRLDFSCETDDCERITSAPAETVHVHTSHFRKNQPGQSKGSVPPVQLHTGSPMASSCKRNNNHREEDYSHKSDHHTDSNSKPVVFKKNSMRSSHTRLSPKFTSSLQPKSRPATVGSKTFTTNKLSRHRKGASKKEALFSEAGITVLSEHMVNATPVYESKRTAGYNYGLPLCSPPTPRDKQPSGQRINVCVRKRPLTRQEFRRGEADVVSTLGEECVIVHESKEAVDLSHYILQHRFYFDQVFGEESSNEEVYQRTTYPLVQHMLKGGKATCFAYGQTGAGKTHTMLGSSPGRPGLYALAVRDIFAHLSTTRMHSPLLVYVSFFEIYCGQLYDLLDHRKRLFAREDGQKVVHIAGLRDVRVDSVGSLLEVISQGTEERTQGVSGVNPLSSRSHALLQIQLRGPNQQVAGRMCFVDLAGSERASDTKQPDRQSRMEGAEINQSLLALKECIRSLDQEQLHTPFRQSKLTQVLKDSFVGDSMTCMIANISPGHLATEHTLNTLRYADRVKELKGHRGLRRGRRAKTIPSPKHNLSNSDSSIGDSSVGTRGDSPPKTPKLRRQRKTSGITTPTTNIAIGGPCFCSTPKSNRWVEESSPKVKKQNELEQITPIRDLFRICDNRESLETRGGRYNERRETLCADHSTGDKNIKSQPVSEQKTVPQRHLRDEQRKSEVYSAKTENQQSNLKGDGVRERKCAEERRQVYSSKGMCNEEERLKERHLQKIDEREKERKTHLRQYHQQLQQFKPSSASSSDHPFSVSTCSSFSSSKQASLSSSVSQSFCAPLQQSSHMPASALMRHGLDKVLDKSRSRIEGRSEEECRQDRDRRGKNTSLKMAGGEKSRVQREDWRMTGMERAGERRWAWEGTAVTEQVNRRTTARPAEVQSGDLGAVEAGSNSLDIPVDGLWDTEESAASNSLVSIHNNCLFKQQISTRAPAERPLSPASEESITPLTLNTVNNVSPKLKHTRYSSNILQKVHQEAQSSSQSEKDPHFQINANKRENSTSQPELDSSPLTSPITQKGCRIPAEPCTIASETPAQTQVHNNTVLVPEESSLSCIMDPLSISLLQVDQQAATASFLQGEHNSSSLCLVGNERKKDQRRDVEEQCHACIEIGGNGKEDVDVDLHLSLLELSKTKTATCHLNPDIRAAADRRDKRNGVMKPPITEVIMGCLQDLENLNFKTTTSFPARDNPVPASPLNPSACVSIETPTSSSGQNAGHISSPQMLKYVHNGHKNQAVSNSIPLSQSVLGQLNTWQYQCPTVPSNYSCNSDISVQLNSLTELSSEESNSNLQMKSMNQELNNSQWRVIQAHWQQLEEMEGLCRKEGTLLCQQPDMAFGEYVHKLGEIMERKMMCVHSMIAQLQPYLNHPHYHGENYHDQTM
ncbi:uncharacterized protein V6R79_022300 [Siganus canaliculatus]